MVISIVGFLSALLVSATAVSQPIPKELAADPAADASHPSRLEAVHIPSFGVKFNGTLYVAAGAAPHPTAIFLKGLPGIEQNLDLAQAVRRAGWNALTMHTRGSWGSPGVYSYRHLLEDAASALAFVRDPANASKYSIDTRRIVLVGHSTGGFIAALTAADAHGLAGLILISATDDASEAVTARKTPAAWRQFVKGYADYMDGLAGCTPDGLATEVLRHASSWNLAAAAPRLRALPVLIVNSDDGYASESEALADEIGQQSRLTPTRVHIKTDHAYSDHRIALETVVIEWLQNNVGAQ
jgi:pimeloyl-ACP methyl ester carboxylesterase